MNRRQYGLSVSHLPLHLKLNTAMYLCLQDQPQRWMMETYGRLVNTDYLIDPYDGVLTKQPEYRFTLSISEQNFRRKAEEDLHDAERWVDRQLVNPAHKARLNIFNADSDIYFKSLHPFKFTRSSIPTPTRYEGQMVKLWFTLFNFDDGEIIPRVERMELVRDDYNPDNDRVEEEEGVDDGW